MLSSLITTALLAATLSSAIPTARQEPEASTSGTQRIPLARRSNGDLQLPDGTLDWAKTHAHLARAQSKYQRSTRSFKRNLASSQPPSFDEPELAVDLSLPTTMTDDDDFLTPISEVGAASVDDEELSLEKRAAAAITDGRVFSGDAGVRGGKKLKGLEKPSESLAKRVATDVVGKIKAIANPKYIANPKNTASKTGGNALTEYSNGMLWAGKITIGTPPVPYIIDFDTGSADLWIPSINCTSAACNTHSKYNPALSTTSRAVPSKKLSIQYGDGSTTTGSVWTDTVTVAGITAVAQTFGTAEALSADWEDDPMDGLMGMGYQAISQINAPPFFRTLMTQGKVLTSQFSFKLASIGSELFLGGLNTALFVAGSTVWYPVSSQSYWIIPATANVAGQTVTAIGTFGAIIDTGTSVVVAPTVDAANFWAAVPNSAVYGSGYYTFDCASPPSISLSFGTTKEKWAISGASLNLGRVSTGSTRCVGAIVGADIGVAGWVVGGSFLEGVYSSFDFTRNAVGFSKLA